MDVPFKLGRNRGIMSITPDFKPGDLPPPSHAYNDWHAWADVQRKAGIKQAQCGSCGLWRTPQEMSAITRPWSAFDRYGTRVHLESKVCLKCAERPAQNYSTKETP
jgi:hypothetical protein